MSSFSIPPLSGGINFNVSQFTSAMGEVASRVGQVPGMVDEGIDRPMKEAETAMAHAGQSAKEIGSSVEHGMMASQAAMQLFPALVVEFIENPILGAIAAIGELTKSLVDIIGDVAGHFQTINLGAIKSGLDPEVFASYSMAAKAAGVETAQFGLGLEMMQQRAQAALDGDKQAAKGFKDLGLGAKRLSELLHDPREMLLSVADGMKALPTAGAKAEVAMEALGRQGKELIPFFDKGRDGIESLAKMVAELEGQTGKTQAGWGAAWAEMSTLFEAAWEGIKAAIATPILEYLADHAKELTDKLKEVTHWIEDRLASAMSDMGPRVESLASEFMDVAEAVVTLLVPALEILGPIIKYIADEMKRAADESALFVNAASAIGNAIKGSFTGDFDDAKKSWQDTKQSWSRVEEDYGYKPASVTVQKVEVHAEHGSSASQLGQPIKDAIEKAKREWHQGERVAHKVNRAMGARH